MRTRLDSSMDCHCVFASKLLKKSWRTLTLVVTLLLFVSCSHTDEHSEEIVAEDWRASREPYLVFDSASFAAERLRLIRSGLPGANQLESGTYTNMVRQWLQKGSPQRFWKEVASQVGISRILLTYEVGGSETGYYWSAGIIESPCGSPALVSTGFPPAQDSLIVQLIDPDQLRTVKNELENELQIRSLHASYKPDIQDASIVFLFSYFSTEPIEFVSNCAISDSLSKSYAVVSYLNSLFQMYEP